MAPPGLDTVWSAVQKAIPDVILKRKLNFITIHYIYIVGCTLLGAIIFWAIGGIAFIDALFFTAGSATQSGLNTVDVNKLFTGQQVVTYILMMMCNPIVIHTSVVFVRLYWFEKRFKDIVREARSLRRTRSRSRRRDSLRSEETESIQPAMSVRGRAIQLLRSSGHKNHGKTTPTHPEPSDAHNEKPAESSDTSQDQGLDAYESIEQRRGSATSMEDIRLPQQMNTEQHIQFLENQRNPKDNTTLRIPSPREFDRGGRVQSIDETSDGLHRQVTNMEHGPTSPEISHAPRVANHITFEEPDLPASARQNVRATTFPRVETGKASTLDQNTYYGGSRRGRSVTRRGSAPFVRTNTSKTLEAAPYLSWQPTVARNSFFVNLTEEQREELGGIEYRALKTLLLILLGYFLLFHLFGIVCLVPWIYRTHYGSIVTGDGQGRTWWGIYTAASAFNDLGFTLTPDSMISFQTAVWPLLLMTFLIIIGNTGFPCMLRFVIWVISKCVPVGGGLWEELQFLLDHPRRCFTLLFPRAATWWLFAILIMLNGIDLLFFVVLDLNDPTVTVLSPGIRVLDGLFQAASTRTAGFAAVNIANLHPAIQVSYLIMMYISVFPIAISMRRTNVYEEKSLGIYASGAELELEDKDPSYVGAHLRKQLSFDLWYVFLGLFIICIVEGARLENTNEYAFTIFSVLFEIVSAYGTVGLSLGYPTINASFSAEFKTLSKLVIIAMQIRGRHRGLPYELDRAILLPSEGLHRKEAQEAERIMTRRRSTFSIADTKPADAGITSATTNRSHKDDDFNDPFDESQPGPRQRRFTGRSGTGSSMHSLEHPSGHSFRRGLGNGMYHIADAGSAIKEETESFAHGSH